LEHQPRERTGRTLEARCDREFEIGKSKIAGRDQQPGVVARISIWARPLKKQNPSKFKCVPAVRLAAYIWSVSHIG
jgi:hypothetical protein